MLPIIANLDVDDMRQHLLRTTRSDIGKLLCTFSGKRIDLV